ncbi:MAG TPA: hypothetical protein VMV94_02420 [Phycisphaerae bacterium]|nr:hypothetical protein [Phycisphaerae bacterium]
MLDFRSARDRAMRRAIETGHMPNMDVIHARQKMEGFEPCFGRTEMVCQRTGCRWHGDCAALATFRPVRGLGLRRESRPTLTHAAKLGAATFRDGRGMLEAQHASLKRSTVEPQLK